MSEHLQMVCKWGTGCSTWCVMQAVQWLLLDEADVLQHKGPISASDLAPLFPQGLIAQEMTNERYVDIPEEVSP